MRRKQAPMDAGKAADFGVSGYVPSATTSEIGAVCVREDCGATATKEVTTERPGLTKTERMCDAHARDAQLDWDSLVTVRRLRVR